MRRGLEMAGWGARVYSIGRSTCGRPRLTRGKLTFMKSRKPVSGPHWSRRGLDFLVLATAFHKLRCSWVNSRQRADTALKGPRTLTCWWLRGLYGIKAG